MDFCELYKDGNHFIFPIDGDCLNSHDGKVLNGELFFNVSVAAPGDAAIWVNGVLALWDGEHHNAVVGMGMGKMSLRAEFEDGTPVCRPITVFRLHNAENGYRISSDDNILFLRDIHENRDTYKSIFENAYLAMYKKAHDLYGAKVHLNLFYETDDLHNFINRGNYFNLSMMTDKFVSEFRDNSDWLRFSFHALSDYPDKPYRHASGARIAKDALKVNNEIIRFAGSETLAQVTTVHWGEANEEGTKALRGLGYKTLAGYFEHTKSGKPLVAYYYPDKLIDHVGARDFWMNMQDDIFHSRIDLVLNTIKHEKLIQVLEDIKEQPHRASFLELMIHEQYFHSGYVLYIPEFTSLVLDAAKWAHDNGYHGVFLDEIMPNA